MARGYHDPWKKKSKAGMKAFNSLLTTNYKVGKKVLKESSKKRRTPVQYKASPGCLVSFLFLTAISSILLLLIFNVKK